MWVPLWASCCLGSRNPSDCALVSSRDEFREFPGRISGVPKHRRRSQPAEPEEPDSGSNLFGMENPAPAESTAFNAAEGKPWPFSSRPTFAGLRAEPNPDSGPIYLLSWIPRSARNSAESAPRTDWSAEIWVFRARFARRLRNSGRVGSLSGRRLAGAGAGAGEPAGSPARLGVARFG